MPTKTIFLDNLLRLMKSANKKVFASYCRVSDPTVFKWMHGDRFPNPENLDKIAEFFGIDVADLFRDVDPADLSPESINAALKILARANGYDVNFRKPKDSK